MITIDRLVLSIDGMSPERASRLARLAARQLAEERGGDAGWGAATIDRIEVALPATRASDAAIAATLCAAIRAKVG